MALHTQSQFAALCGLTNAELSVNKSRGKIVMSGDYVDDTIAKNKEFLEKWQAKKGITSQNVEQVKAVPPPKASKSTGKKVGKPVDENQLPAPDVEEPEQDLDKLGMNQLDLIHRRKEIEKKEQEIARLKLDVAKKEGLVIPTDLVKTVFIQHNKNIITAFHNAGEQLLIEIGHKKGLSRAEIAELRDKLIKIINDSADVAINESKKNIKHIVEEHSEKRGVGEKK